MHLYQLASTKKVKKKKRKTPYDFDDELDGEEERSPDFLELQSSIGNQGMVHFVQRKLGSGRKDVQYYINQNYTSNLFSSGTTRSPSQLGEDRVKLDYYEKQSDRVVDQVMKMSSFENREVDDEFDWGTEARQVELGKAKLPGLPTILYDPFFGKSFRSFANQNAAADDIDCYLQIENYRRQPNPSLALSIFDSYIRNDKVKLSGAAKQAVGSQVDPFRRMKHRHRKKYRMRQAVSSLFGKKPRRKQKGNPDLFFPVTRELQENLNATYHKFIYSKECNTVLSKANSLLVSLHQNDMI